MSGAFIDENDEIWNLQQKEYETDTQFIFRKEIYDKVYNKTKSKQKATLYSNYWVNILSMKCQYPKDIMDVIEEYKPENDIYNVKL